VRSSGGIVSLLTEVSAITVDAGRVTGVQVGQRHIAAPLVINAAGVYADTLAATAGSRRYSIHPRRGSLVLFDPGADARYLTSIWQVPGAYSKGCGMTARPSGFTTGNKALTTNIVVLTASSTPGVYTLRQTILAKVGANRFVCCLPSLTPRDLPS